MKSYYRELLDHECAYRQRRGKDGATTGGVRVPGGASGCARACTAEPRCRAAVGAASEGSSSSSARSMIGRIRWWQQQRIRGCGSEILLVVCMFVASLRCSVYWVQRGRSFRRWWACQRCHLPHIFFVEGMMTTATMGCRIIRIGSLGDPSTLKLVAVDADGGASRTTKCGGGEPDGDGAGVRV